MALTYCGVACPIARRAILPARRRPRRRRTSHLPLSIASNSTCLTYLAEEQLKKMKQKLVKAASKRVYTRAKRRRKNASGRTRNAKRRRSSTWTSAASYASCARCNRCVQLATQVWSDGRLTRALFCAQALISKIKEAADESEERRGAGAQK